MSSRRRTQEQLQWPMWGQYYENNGKGGEAPACPKRRSSSTLYEEWRHLGERGRARADLAAHARDPRAAGLHDRHRRRGRCSRSWRSNRVCATCRPKGLWSWDPGSYFGMYHPDTFWLDTQGPADAALRRQPDPADDPDDDRDQHHRLHHHPAAARQLPRKLHRRAAGAGRIGRSAEDRLPEAGVRARQAARRAIPALGRRHAAKATSAIRSSSTCP